MRAACLSLLSVGIMLGVSCSSGDGKAGVDPTTSAVAVSREVETTAEATSNQGTSSSTTVTSQVVETVPVVELEAFDLEFSVGQMTVLGDGRLLLTGFGAVAVFDPLAPVAEGVNPIGAGLPTRDDLLDQGCVDSLVEDRAPNVSLNDSCFPELLDFDPRKGCYWVLLPNTLDCYPVAHLELPIEEPVKPTASTTSVPPASGTTTTGVTTTTGGPTGAVTSTTNGNVTTSGVPPTTNGGVTTGGVASTTQGGVTTSGVTTTIGTPPPREVIVVSPCPPSADGLFDGRNEKSTGTFENTCDPQAPAYVEGGVIDDVPVPFFRIGGGELGYVAEIDGTHQYVKCFQRDDYDVDYPGIGIEGDRITITARGAEFAALGRTYTQTFTWPGCGEIAGSVGEFGSYEQPPHGPGILLGGVEYSYTVEGAADPGDSEHGIGTIFRLTDEDGNELVLSFPEEVIFDQFSVIARDGDDLLVYPGRVNRPDGAEPGPDYDRGTIYRISSGRTGVAVPVDAEFARISAMIVVDDTLWLAQLFPSRIIPVPVTD